MSERAEADHAEVPLIKAAWPNPSLPPPHTGDILFAVIGAQKNFPPGDKQRLI